MLKYTSENKQIEKTSTRVMVWAFGDTADHPLSDYA